MLARFKKMYAAEQLAVQAEEEAAKNAAEQLAVQAEEEAAAKNAAEQLAVQAEEEEAAAKNAAEQLAVQAEESEAAAKNAAEQLAVQAEESEAAAKNAAEQLAGQAEEEAAAKDSDWEETCQAFGGQRKKNLKGVRRLANGRYAAEIRDKVAGRKVWLGTFPSLKLAACAYELAARGMLSGGRHAVPNFERTPSPALREEFDEELAAQALRYREDGGRPVPACLMRFTRVPVMPPVEESFPEVPPSAVRSIPPEPVYIEAIEESDARNANLHPVNLLGPTIKIRDLALNMTTSEREDALRALGLLR